MRKVKYHTFNGRKYLIDIDPCIQEGSCNQYKVERTISVMEYLSTRKGLETLLHECLHASDWTKKEETVERTAREIAHLMWRLGYRTKI